MKQAQFESLKSFIWNIANDVLVYVFVKSDYKNVILPFTVLRRIDVLLEPTKQAVLEMDERLTQNNIHNKAPLLCSASGYPFYNTSQFTMKKLRGESNSTRLHQNFTAYLHGFSKEVKDIIEKLNLYEIVNRLANSDRLGTIIEKFTSTNINLSNKPVLDNDGKEIMPALDNHSMGTLFEELLRKFNEDYNVTEAGEHFTPRDYVQLLADLAVVPVADKIVDNTYSVYDGACGTGGILTIAKERIEQIAKEKGKKVSIDIFGQEISPESYATCKADLMISGEIAKFTYPYAGTDREFISFGSTISEDGHAGENFDFCISNPPFGTPWKEDLRKKGIEEKKKNEFTDSRFKVEDSQGGEISFLPDIGDCQMLFLANNLSRMQTSTKLGTRIVEVHNGSSLFTGNAGGGASNLRKYIIENDLLEAIIAMPEKEFYNTGIGTYIWIVTNRKEERRRGHVQLIDATNVKTPLRKNLGEKNCETSEENIQTILQTLLDFKETEISKIFPNKEFGYWEITVNRPLRLVYENLDAIELPEMKEADLHLLKKVIEIWKTNLGGKPISDSQLFTTLSHAQLKVTKANVKLIRQYLGTQKADAEVCHEKPTDKHSPVVPDSNLKDVEQVPLLYEGGIEAFMQNEVLPYAPDAYVEKGETKIGYELSFTKYFYKPVQLRPIEDILADISSIEEKLKGNLADILNV